MGSLIYNSSSLQDWESFKFWRCQRWVRRALVAALQVLDLSDAETRSIVQSAIQVIQDVLSMAASHGLSLHDARGSKEWLEIAELIDEAPLCLHKVEQKASGDPIPALDHCIPKRLLSKKSQESPPLSHMQKSECHLSTRTPPLKKEDGDQPDATKKRRRGERTTRSLRIKSVTKPPVRWTPEEDKLLLEAGEDWRKMAASLGK